jgi:plasmid replication initiation protein
MDDEQNSQKLPVIVKNIEKISSHNVVTQSNFLIEASYSLSTQEQRILLILISFIEPTHDDLRYYEIEIKELQRVLGLSDKNKSIYSELKEITEKLLGRVVKIRKPDKKELIQTHWLSVAHYKENEGVVGFKIEAALKPYLLELKSFFTKFPLKSVLRLKGIYSIRLYQLLKQYEKIGKRVLTIEEIRKLFDVGKDEYPLYANFKQKVLKYAQEEIKNCTDIEFEMVEGKTGRKVTSIIFMIKRKDKEGGNDNGLAVPEEKDMIDKNFELYSRLIKYFEISEAQTKSIFKQYSPSYILDTANYVEKQYKDKKVESLSGFLNYALKQDLAHTKQTLFQNEEERIKEANKKVAEQKRFEALKKEQSEKLKNNYQIYRTKTLNDYLISLPENEREALETEGIAITNEKFSGLLRFKDGQTFAKDDSLVISTLVDRCFDKARMLSLEQYFEQNKEKYPYASFDVKPEAQNAL